MVSISYPMRWAINAVVYSLAIGVPGAGYLFGVEIIQNFGVAIMCLWAMLSSLIVTATGMGVVLAYFMKDRADRLDLYEIMTERHLLFYVTRFMALVTALVYCAIGYPLLGVYLLILSACYIKLQSLAVKHYKQMKV